MIVAERQPKVAVKNFERFGEEMLDGCLTVPSDGSVYRLREAISLSQKLGRMLTDEEMKKYTLSDG